MRWQVLDSISQQKEVITDQYTISQPHTTTHNIPSHNTQMQTSSIQSTELPPLATVLRGLANTSNLRN